MRNFIEVLGGNGAIDGVESHARDEETLAFWLDLFAKALQQRGCEIEAALVGAAAMGLRQGNRAAGTIKTSDPAPIRQVMSSPMRGRGHVARGRNVRDCRVARED
jgi:hypothetical protein